MPNSCAISIEDLVKVYDRRPVLNHVSLEVAPGEILAIMGSSGGGKTTLLRCISGLTRSDSGHVLVSGIDVCEEPDRARKELGMVFQNAALFDSLTVDENVRFGLKRHTKLSKSEQDDKVREALCLVGLEESGKLMPAELSGGMRKRVGIARALVLEPKVMLYDEPTTGLDPVTTYTIDRLIVDVRQRKGMTSVLVSHDVSSVFRVADRIAFLDGGRLVYTGTPEGFRASHEPSIQEIMMKAQAQVFA